MGQVRKIKAGLVKISVNDFVGEDGNIFFDVDDGVMRLSDGATPGGIPLSAGGGEGGAVTFRQLLDTPSSFTGANSHFVKVNPQASALEFVNVDIFDGDYNSLTNKPTIPDAFDPSSIDQSLLPDTDISYDLGSSAKKWRDLYLSGTTIYLGDSTISRHTDGGIVLPANSRIGTTRLDSLSGVTSYNDLTDKPTIPSDVSDLTDTTNLLAGSTFDGQFSSLLNTPTTISGYGITDAFDGAYSSLTGAPTTVSSFTNDLGYLTTVAYADLTGKPTTLSGYGITDAYTNTQVDTAISTAVNNVLGGAPALLDTLDEIAAAVGDDPNFVTTINNAINLKANTADLHAVATSGDYNDLINVPTIPEDVADLEDRLNAIVPDLQNELYVAALIMG